MGEERPAPRSATAESRTGTVAADLPSSAHWPSLSPGTLFAKRFEIRGLLGSGGFAIVYRAYDQELRREVALKVLRAERMNQSALRRFRREAAVARDVASPRLVRTFDIGKYEAEIYLSMELVDGSSLRQRLDAGPLSVDEALRSAVEILEGLAVLHSVGIVHRDIKPGNILFSQDGAKIGDFGVASVLDPKETRITISRDHPGTPEYMAPEQILGLEVDPRTDLYSLGLVMFEMLTGDLPNRRKSAFATVLAHVHSPFPSVRKLRKDVPPWFARIVARLLQKEPGARYQTAQEVLTHLRGRRSNYLPRRGLSPRIAVGLLLATALVTGGEVVLRRPEVDSETADYSHLVNFAPDSGVSAIGRDGKTLWSRPDLVRDTASHSALARITAHGRPLLATILLKEYEYEPAYTRTLSFLNADTGDLVKKVRLVSAASHFPFFPDRYYPRVLHAEDLDGDGVDEIIIAYQHSPEWPSYAVLYEPRYERSRVLFVSSGGHQSIGVQDLDGDGNSEVIFAGINNVLGWYNGAAAVRVEPWIGEGLDVETEPAATPDDPRSHERNLMWYALLPRRRTQHSAAAISSSPETRTLWIPYEDGYRQPLSFDGFLPLPHSSLSTDAREQRRREAYRHLRESLRVLRAAFPDQALTEIEAAKRAAEDAADPLLMECIERIRGRALVAAARIDEAEELFNALSSESMSASEIAFDAAESLHLHGDLRRAIAWYRRGTGVGGGVSAGKSKFEYLKGAVLALTELHEWTEALEEINRFEAAYPSHVEDCAVYREYVRWRSGDTPTVDRLQVRPSSVDAHRYWLLEFQNARGDDPASVLKDARQVMEEAHDARGPLLSLESDLLLRLGKKSEALDAAREALHLVADRRSVSTIARSHLGLVATRFAHTARENQLEDEAARAERLFLPSAPNQE